MASDAPTTKELKPETKSRLEAAVKELFSSKDFHQVNMRSIAQKAGVGLNTIYLYYESKEKMLFSFVNEWIIQLDYRIADHLQGLETFKEKMRKSIWVILDFYERNPDIAEILLLTVPFKTWMTDATFKQRDTAMRIINLFREGQDTGKLNPDIPAEVMFDILYGTIHRLTYMWIYLEKEKSLTGYAGMLFDIIWWGIANRDNTGETPSVPKTSTH